MVPKVWRPENSKNYRGYGNTTQSGDYGIGLGRCQNNIAGKLDSMLIYVMFYGLLILPGCLELMKNRSKPGGCYRDYCFEDGYMQIPC